VKLRFTPRAHADIEHIYEYITQHDTRAATAVVRQIRLTSGLLAQYPGIGRDTDISGVRVLPTARYPYLVYYRLGEDELTSIHVRDGRRQELKAGEL
jgi:plasmid stabilization system protein ParE